MSEIAVITGGSSGIGRAVALSLADEGCSVAVVGRDEERLREVSAEAGDKVAARWYRADLRSEDEISALSKRIENDLGRVDVLVHAAGIISLGEVALTSTSEIDEQYEVNLRAPLLLTRELLPMIQSVRGQIVFINSSAGLDRGVAGKASYSSTKHGLRALADSLREEVNPRGIRVLSVFPGSTATPMQEGLHDSDGRVYRPERLLKPEDVASAVVFCLKLPGSAEITELSIRPMLKP